LEKNIKSEITLKNILKFLKEKYSEFEKLDKEQISSNLSLINYIYNKNSYEESYTSLL
jgi:hypothetical protein